MTQYAVFCETHEHYLKHVSSIGTTWRSDPAEAKHFDELAAHEAAKKATWLDHQPVVVWAPSLVPAHMNDVEGGFCPGGEKIQLGGRCQYGCDHAEHYSNDGHPECVDTSGEPR